MRHTYGNLWSVTVRILCLGLMAGTISTAPAQRFSRPYLSLSEDYFRSGDAVLGTFSPAVATARHSVVEFDLDGKPAVLGAVVTADGLVVTKASELKAGHLTARLSDGRTVDVLESITDPRNDVALVKIQAKHLQPVSWTTAGVALGQWVITPGLGREPEAVGVLSAATRRLHKRAYIGVVLDTEATNACIASVEPGFGAANAGLREGDVILAVNGTPIKDREALMTALREFRDGQTVQLHVERAGQEFDASVEMKSNAFPEPPPFWRGRSREDRMNRFGSELSQRADDFELAMQHDTVLEPWQCGGPLVNLDGRAIGLNIARAGRIASYALPAALVKTVIEELLAKPMKPIEAGADGK